MQTLSAELLASAAARNADTASSCFQSLMDGNPNSVAPLDAHLIVKPEKLQMAELQAWVQGSFSGTDDSFQRLIWMLQELCWLDGVARRLAHDQAWADAFVRHSIVTVRAWCCLCA